MTLVRQTWPLQSGCWKYYGDPTLIVQGAPQANAEWERRNLVTVPLPWKAHASWDRSLRIKSLRVHTRVAASLARIVAHIWAVCGQSQEEIDRLGLSSVGGGYAWRPMRGGGNLSMHAFGAAVDFDPERNGLGDDTPNFGRPENRWVVDAFTAEGWTWGGIWKRKDGMHFQAARVD